MALEQQWSFAVWWNPSKGVRRIFQLSYHGDAKNCQELPRAFAKLPWNLIDNHNAASLQNHQHEYFSISRKVQASIYY